MANSSNTPLVEDLLSYVRIDLTEDGGTRSMIECDTERLRGLLQRLTSALSETGKRCPIGLDVTPEICSAGTCDVCRKNRSNDKRERALWLADKLAGDYGSEAAQLLRYFAQSAMTPLEQFGIAVLEEHRNEICDVDGGWVQDKAVELGLLVGVEATEPCGEYCKCAEYGDFPQECLREADAIGSKMAEFRSRYVQHQEEKS